MNYGQMQNIIQWGKPTEQTRKKEEKKMKALKELYRKQLPPGFGPGHPQWNVPSYRNKYLIINGYQFQPPQGGKRPTNDSIPAVVKNENETDPEEKQRQRGSMCITAFVSGRYQWYAPLFVYQAHRAYPEYNIAVIFHGAKINLPDDLRGKIVCDEYGLGLYRNYTTNGETTAALRFVEGEKELSGFDNVLITDIDMMIVRENPDMLTVRLNSMTENGLDCYDNYAVLPDYRMPGTHFITKKWWEKTRNARMKLRNQVIGGSPSYDYDEKLLYRIAKESGLPISNKIAPWNEHGIHLGAYRREPNRLDRRPPSAVEQSSIRDMLSDDRFMGLVERCGEHLPEIKTIFDTLKKGVS